MAIGIIISIIILLICLGYWVGVRQARRQERRQRISNLVDRALAKPEPKPEPKHDHYFPVPVFESKNLVAAAARGIDAPASAGVAKDWIAMPPFVVKGQRSVFAVEIGDRIQYAPAIQAGDLVYCALHGPSYQPIEDELVLVALPVDRCCIRHYHGKKGQEIVLGTVLGIARWDV